MYRDLHLSHLDDYILPLLLPLRSHDNRYSVATHYLDDPSIYLTSRIGFARQRFDLNMVQQEIRVLIVECRFVRRVCRRGRGLLGGG